MPKVSVELRDKSTIAVEYTPYCTTSALLETLVKDLYGDAYNAYIQLEEISLVEVCQQGLCRRVRPCELVQSIVDTWTTHTSNLLRVEPSLQEDLTTTQTRVLGLQVKFSVLSQDWVNGAIDVFDRMLYLRSTDFNSTYQGAWKSVELNVLDVYRLPDRPGLVVLRSQLPRHELKDASGRLLALHLSVESAQLLTKIIHTARTKALIASDSRRSRTSQPRSGTPPNWAVAASPRAKLSKKALLTPPDSPRLASASPHIPRDNSIDAELSPPALQQALQSALRPPASAPVASGPESVPAPAPTGAPTAAPTAAPPPPPRSAPELASKPPPVPPKDKYWRRKKKTGAETPMI